jgi:copper chaperone NosL
MKKAVLFLLLSAVLSGAAAFALERVEAPAKCQECGMDRSMFAYSRMLVVYTDGTGTGICSLHCAAENLKTNADKKVKSLQVADYNSKLLVDAKKATWVIGGKKSGVMTAQPKWAFAQKADAEAFIKANGGTLAGFDEALAQADKE